MAASSPKRSKMRASSSDEQSISRLLMRATNRLALSGLGQRRSLHYVLDLAVVPVLSAWRRLRSRHNRRGPRPSERANTEAPPRRLPARPTRARGSQCAARLEPCIKFPPASGVLGLKDRRLAQSTPKPLRRASDRSDQNRDRRGRARSPLPPARLRRRIAPRLEIDALCLAWRKGGGKSWVIGRLVCMSGLPRQYWPRALIA